MENHIKEKINKLGVPLNKWNVQINYGIKTGYNEAFIINGLKRDELIKKSPTSKNIIRPILRGRDIQKYKANWQDLYIIETFPTLKLDIEQFPAIKEHLLSFGIDRLKQTGDPGARKKTNNKWFETQDSISYRDDFFKQKIIYPNMTKFLPFYYDEHGFLTNQKCFIITGKNIGFLTAFFNSSIFKFCFKESFPELQGGTRELSKVFFDKIPVIQITDKQNQQFEIMVKEVQSMKNQKTDTLALEKQIDQLIFDLYDLNDDERNAVGYIEIK